MKRHATLNAGIGAVVAALILRYVPLITIAGRHVTDNQVHGLCSSTLGTLAQAMYQAAANDCTAADSLFTVSTLLLIGGGLVAAAGLVALLVARGTRPVVDMPLPPPPPAVMTSAEDGYR